MTECKFQPREPITITACGMDIHGRVERCIYCGNEWLYDVDYWVNSERRRGEFAEDELSPRKPAKGKGE